MLIVRELNLLKCWAFNPLMISDRTTQLAASSSARGFDSSSGLIPCCDRYDADPQRLREYYSPQLASLNSAMLGNMRSK